MVSSTSQGGGVAEMLHTIVPFLRDLGVSAEWVVIGSDEPDFFALTKHIHNLIHGAGTPRLGPDERALFERVASENADALRPRLKPGDILVVHDPQPLPMAAILRQAVPLTAIWRCHIGLDMQNDATNAAWEFLAPWFDAYDHAVFSAPEYIPQRLAGRSTVIAPGIDPLSPKNTELSVGQTVEVLCNGALAVAPGPMLHLPYDAPARRLLADGTFVRANAVEDIGLLTRPIVTQISRWDRLKGWAPLLRAFAQLKAQQHEAGKRPSSLHRRRLELVRLVLAGPDPASIADDPEGREVIDELRATYIGLPGFVQRDIALVALPMRDRTQNALMVNAIQRASSIVVQNSLREGFGLTVTEAMWKQVPVVSNRRACGPRQQIRDGMDGRLIDDAEDVDELAGALDALLADARCRDRMGRSAQRRAHDEFMVFTQVRRWLEILAEL
jgi:trehalose synthase